MVAADFQTVGNSSDNTTILLQNFIKGDFTGTTDANTAPQIQIWDPSTGGGIGGYTFYYFFSQSSGSAATAYRNFWGPNRTKANVPGYLELTVSLGQSVWFKCHENCTIQVAGQVAEVAEKNIQVYGNNKWNMLANPWPVALNINSNVNWKAAGLVGTTDASTAPQIQVWDVTAGGGVGGYTFYYFFSQSSGSAATAYKDFWGPNRTKANVPEYLKLTIPVGQGFWLKYSGDDMTLTFSK